mgnify:CR=1 FL=1
MLVSSFFKDEVRDFMESEFLRLLKEVDLEMDFFFSCLFSPVSCTGSGFSMIVVVGYLSLLLDDALGAVLRDALLLCLGSSPEERFS